MAFSEPYTISAVTVGTTELSIVSGTTTLQTVTDDGVYQLVVDPVAAGLAKGDSFTLRIYDKTLSGSTKRVLMSQTISDGASELWVSPSVQLIHGWDMTIQKISGTDRAFDASIRKIA